MFTLTGSHRHRGTPWRVVSLLALLAVLVSCSPPPGGTTSVPTATVPLPTPTSAQPTILRVAIPVVPDTIDTALINVTNTNIATDNVIETLVATDKKGNLRPHLAADWKVSPDGLEYDITLRKDVFFHDGNPLNAQAVKWSLDRLLDPNVKVGFRTAYTAIQSVEAVDDSTVKIKLNRPYAPLMGALTIPISGIHSPAAANLEGNSRERLNHLVGTGPYVFKEWDPKDHVLFTRNDNYWGKQKPYYDQILVKFVPDAATREKMLLAGELDIISHPPLRDLPTLQKNPAVVVRLEADDGIFIVTMNNLNKTLSDVRVRQALNYAIDRQTIINSVYLGTGTPLDAPMSPVLWGYCPQKLYEYDPAKAKQLLAEAGVTDLKLDLFMRQGLTDQAALAAISQQLEAVGVKTVTRTVDVATWRAEVYAPPETNKTELMLFTFRPPFMDPAIQMFMYESTQHPPKSMAFAFYKNTDVDALIKAAEQEMNLTRRKDLYCQANKLIWDDAPVIFLWTQQFPLVYQANLTNIEFDPVSKFYTAFTQPVQ